MDKLFTDSTISTEMIEYQPNDDVVVELEHLYKVLISLADKYSTKLVNGRSFFRNKDTKKIIEAIDKTIYKRFGIHTQHINGVGKGYAVLPIPPINVNVISGDVSNRFKEIEQYLGKTSCNPEIQKCNKEVTSKDVSSSISDLFKDQKSVVYSNYQSYLALDETLNGSGVLIDLKKAYIKDLPKEYKVFLITDLFMMIRTLKLSPKELVAVVMHEIGHAFTHLEYSYRTVKNTTVLIDTLKKDLIKHNDVQHTLNILYNDVLDGNEDISKKSTALACVKVMDKYMEQTNLMSANDRHSSTDSEQLADQFASRFGLGSDLVTALNKFHTYTPIEFKDNIVLTIVTLLIGILMTIVLMPAIITGFISTIILTIVFGGSNSNELTYDLKVRRYQRIKNDLIRTIRTVDLDKKYIKQILSELKIVDDIIAKSGNDKTLLGSLGDTLLPWNSKISTFKKIEEYLEDLTENELHVASLKLRNLKGK